MKIQYFSDLHLETNRQIFQQAECDVIVIAGDSAPGCQMVDWIDTNMRDLSVPIIVVAGNHEFYDRNMYEHYAILKRRYNEIGVDFLQNESVLILDTLFIGATLWTDYDLYRDQAGAMLAADKIMNDYVFINGNYGRMSARELLAEHQKSKEFITNTLISNAKTSRTCVVTHHAPSIFNVDMGSSERYGPYYASNLELLMMRHEPNLWIHGHIHQHLDHEICNTRVVCNPRGRGNENPLFDIMRTVNI